MRRALALLAAACVFTAPAFAGRSCEVRKPTVASIERGLDLAQRTAQALEAQHVQHGTKVVVLARAGQDLSRYGVRYSHLGFAYRTVDGTGQPVWRVLHKLNHCGTAEAALYRQGLGEFFLDDPWRYETAWVALAPQVQERVVAVLEDGARAARLHHRPYNLVSYPWSLRYQQSNQWALETLALAVDGATTRHDAQAWLQQRGYQPTVLRLGALTRLGARVGTANVAFDDHPDAKRFADRIETVTVDSVFAWLQRSALGGAPVRLAL